SVTYIRGLICRGCGGGGVWGDGGVNREGGLFCTPHGYWSLFVGGGSSAATHVENSQVVVELFYWEGQRGAAHPPHHAM
ncbi:hypothetical protein AUN04_14215, partial [Cronobacter sakazakii]